MPEYKYYIEGRRVYPYNTRELSFKIACEDDTIIYRKKLDGKIILKDDDYDIMLPDENSEIHIPAIYGLNDKLTFKVFETVNSQDIEIWKGEFKLINCEFNALRKQVTFKPTVSDDYSGFFENKDKEINILNIETRKTVSINYSSIIEFYPDFPQNNPASDYYSLWIDFYHDYTTKEIYETQQNGNVHYNVWAYERLVLPKNVTPEGDDWYKIVSTDDYNIWGRPWDTDSHFDTPTIDNIEFNYPIIEMSEGYKSIIKVRDVAELGVIDSYELKYNNIQSQDHANCINLKTALEYIVSQIAPSFNGDVKSSLLFGDDFGLDIYIEPTVTQFTDNLYLIEKSDFIKPNASQSATAGNITFKKLIDDLKELFAGNLYWKIDGAGDLRIEHIEYFESQVGLNLTDEKYSRYVNNIDNFSYDDSKIYSREIWEMNETGNNDFIKNEIDYGEIIAIAGTDENKKEHKIYNLYTDVDYLNEHLDEISNSGFVLVCTEGTTTLTCKLATGQISGESIQNANLSLANMLYNYGRYDRPIKNFTLNGEEIEALTTKRLKKQMEFEFTKLDAIDYSKLFQTSMGAGRVDEAKEELTKRVKIKLLYR